MFTELSNARILAHGARMSAQDAAALCADVLAPKLSRLRLDTEVFRKAQRKKAGVEVVAAGALIGLGVFGGIFPPQISESMKAVSGVSEHDWLEGRGEKLYLIAMIDDATSRLFARFVRHDSTEENHETAVELPGKVRAAVGVLYGQGEYLPNGAEAQKG